jgi:hypothetical protein
VKGKLHFFCIFAEKEIMIQAKSYSKFTYNDIEELGLSVIRDSWLEASSTIMPSSLLEQILALNLKLPLFSEKAKSELIITPVLNEIWSNNQDIFTIYSGYSFEVDKTRGLKGFCDYMLAMVPQSVFINTPIITLVEAKNEEDLSQATPQCAAEMYAAQLYNIKRNHNIPIIYGIITSGFEWVFLKLEDNLITMDTRRYFLNDIPQLLGVLQTLIDTFKGSQL